MHVIFIAGISIALGILALVAVVTIAVVTVRSLERASVKTPSREKTTPEL